jgi:hypothetical protein
MFVVAATLYNRTERTRNSVRHLRLLHWSFVNMLFSGKRTLNNIDGGPEKKIKELSDVLMKRRKTFLDQATIGTRADLRAAPRRSRFDRADYDRSQVELEYVRPFRNKGQ